jgi:hypothetical protein
VADAPSQTLITAPTPVEPSHPLITFRTHHSSIHSSTNLNSPPTSKLISSPSPSPQSPSTPSSQSSAPQSRTPLQSDPARSSHIATRRTRVERSFGRVRLWRTLLDGGLGPSCSLALIFPHLPQYRVLCNEGETRETQMKFWLRRDVHQAI